MGVSKLRLGVNTRFLSQPVTGVQRYGREILAELETFTDVEIESLAANRSGIRSRAWEFFGLAKTAKTRNLDAILGLTNWGPVTGQEKSIVVLHDTLILDQPQSYSPAYRALAKSYFAAVKAGSTQLVTVSKRSQSRLSDVFNREIALAPCGVRPPSLATVDAFRQDVLGRFGLSHKGFALMVGAHDPRKNAEFILNIEPYINDLGLETVLTMRSFSNAHSSYAQASSDRIRTITDPTDQELWALYRGAAVLLQPSLGEGFGLPLLEAASMGTPFISSPTGAAEELAVSTSQVVDLDVAAWGEAIRSLNSDISDDGGELVRLSESYSWAASARALVEVAQNVHNSK
jgi:glycosyltransferase involved in cell wall biosynthesis